jgi:hypothetical protein
VKNILKERFFSSKEMDFVFARVGGNNFFASSTQQIDESTRKLNFLQEIFDALKKRRDCD